MKQESIKESFAKGLFFVSAVTAIITIVLMCYFIFRNGIPFILDYGILDFLLGRDWSPSNQPASFGIFPMVIGSFIITFGALLFGVPTSILTAVFMIYYCPRRLYAFLKSSLNLMSAIPSIVYGFFGLQLLVPWLRTWGGNGLSVLTASILLGIMILPTISSLSEAAIRTVPKTYYSGSLALGAGHERSIFKVVLPAAKSGILSAIILGLGRAIGETMAVILVAGNQPIIATTLFSGTRTLTTNIVLEMAYASGEHRQALMATSTVLFTIILMINACFAYVKGKTPHD